MRQNTFKILFYIKKTRVLKDGRNPLYLRITVNGVREETSISQSIDPKLWDSKKGCAKGNKPEASTINFLLEDIRGSLTNIRRQIERDGEPLSAKLVMDVYTGKINPQKTLVEVFTVYNKKFWEKTKAGLKATATAKRYDRTLLYLQQFMKSEYKSDDIHLNRLNPSFITNFEHFLLVKKGCAHNASKKYLKLLRTIIIDALANGWIKKDPFYSISTAEKKTIPTSLTLLEVEKILNKQFESRCLNKIKDFFLFSCYTGLSFADVKNLKRNNLSEELSSNNKKVLCINKARIKTDVPYFVPLTDLPQLIVYKYINTDECKATGKVFPIPSNQKVNEYLKDIAKLCGINKRLTFHVARHTFATGSLSRAIPVGTISKILGHTNTAMSEHYARQSTGDIITQMDKMNGIFEMDSMITGLGIKVDKSIEHTNLIHLIQSSANAV